MSHPGDIRVADAPFEPDTVLADFRQRFAQSGGIASFLGQVRGGGVEALELTHYPPMTLPGMESLGREATRRFALQGFLAHHRIGRMAPGEPIVLVAAAAPHRRAAFDAVNFAMDHLKTAAWFWKRELADGIWRWIEPRAADHEDAARWAGDPQTTP